MVLGWALIGPIQTFTCIYRGSELISSTPQTDCELHMKPCDMEKQFP